MAFLVKDLTVQKAGLAVKKQEVIMDDHRVVKIFNLCRDHFHVCSFLFFIYWIYIRGDQHGMSYQNQNSSVGLFLVSFGKTNHCYEGWTACSWCSDSGGLPQEYGAPYGWLSCEIGPRRFWAAWWKSSLSNALALVHYGILCYFREGIAFFATWGLIISWMPPIHKKH